MYTQSYVLTEPGGPHCAISQCKSCGSSRLTDLNSEVCIHFSGLKGLDVEPIFVFPKLKVCLDCGFVDANLSEGALEQVREGTKEGRAASA
jgi:hypothetical protein